MKRIIKNTLAVIALTICASQAKAQLASDSPSPAFKPAAATAVAARPAAELQTASSSSAVAESKKTAVSAAPAPSQGNVQEVASAAKKAEVKLPEMQGGMQPKEELIKQPVKAVVPSQE